MLLFETKQSAGELRNFLSGWHYNNPLTASGLVISVERQPTKLYVEESKLKPVCLISLVTTKQGETDSPIQSLEDLEGHVY